VRGLRALQQLRQGGSAALPRQQQPGARYREQARTPPQVNHKLVHVTGSFNSEAAAILLPAPTSGMRPGQPSSSGPALGLCPPPLWRQGAIHLQSAVGRGAPTPAASNAKPSSTCLIPVARADRLRAPRLMGPAARPQTVSAGSTAIAPGPAPAVDGCYRLHLFSTQRFDRLPRVNRRANRAGLQAILKRLGRFSSPDSRSLSDGVDSNTRAESEPSCGSSTSWREARGAPRG